MASVTGDFSKGKVSMVILKLGLPMMLRTCVTFNFFMILSC